MIEDQLTGKSLIEILARMPYEKEKIVLKM